MDINEKIIAEVKKYDSLYNTQSEAYKNHPYREELWCKIARDVGLPVREVKRKFRNIRDSYKKNKRRLKSGTETYIKPYKYADLLKFLDGFSCTENTSFHISESSLDITTDTFSDTEFSCVKKAKVNKIENNEDSWQDPLQSPCTSTITSTSTNQQFTRTKAERRTKLKRNCTMQLFQCLANKITETKLTMEQRNSIESSVCKLVYEKIAKYSVDYASTF